MTRFHPPDLTLTLRHVHPTPVLHRASPGVAGGRNAHGFEGGRCLKLDGTYHLFTAEMCGEPFCVKMRLAHWTSADPVHGWTRVSTLFESSGDYTGRDPRAALWSPMPVWNEEDDRWEFFYVAYRCAPNTAERLLTNHEGRVWRTVSETPGRGGIGGPYRAGAIVLEPGADSDAWEGLQGTDSFFPFRVADGEGEWLAFYGSCQTQFNPVPFFGVGLARADRLAGPWTRCSALNPVLIDDFWVENPVVHRLGGDDGDGPFIALFDAGARGAIGYSVSWDGRHWSTGRYAPLPETVRTWARTVRTPLGLVPEPDGTFSVFFTAFDRGYEDPDVFANLGVANVSVEFTQPSESPRDELLLAYPSLAGGG